MVESGTRVLSAAKMLKIKDSTAKMIFKKHKDSLSSNTAEGKETKK